VALFGARGEAHLASDYDIAVLQKDPDSFWQESGRLAEIETDIRYETGDQCLALSGRSLPWADSSHARRPPRRPRFMTKPESADHRNRARRILQ
jgi:hypothetical protein